MPGLLGGEIAHQLAVDLEDVVPGPQSGPPARAPFQGGHHGEEVVFIDQIQAGFRGRTLGAA